MIQAALSYLGVKYKYGGKNPLSGFDCSGFVSELLKGVGVIPHKSDFNAQHLCDYLSSNGGSYDKWGAGSVAFYGKDAKTIDHVAFCLDQFTMIEAGGGGPTTMTFDDAAAKNACVRIRPIKYRLNFLFVIKPDYSKIGIIK